MDTGTRGRVVGKREPGATFPEIAAHLSLPQTTVQHIYDHFAATGSVKPLKSPGRPRKLTERDERGIVRYAKANRRATLTEITNVTPASVSESTVRRVLHQAKIFARVAPKKPFLSSFHQSKRLAFAKEHQNWTAEQWAKVIWIDESTFEIGKAFRRVLVWRTANEKYYPECLTPTFKSGRTSVMIYACFAGSEKSTLVFMPKGERTAVDFVRLCYEGEGGLKAFREQINIHDAILMEDGAPVHRSNAPKKWREDQGLTKLDWPANSPDLNPIENIWAILKDAVQHRHTPRPKTVDEMKEALQMEWEKIPGSSLSKLLSSMPARMQAGIKAKGGPTRW